MDRSSFEKSPQVCLVENLTNVICGFINLERNVDIGFNDITITALAMKRNKRDKFTSAFLQYL
jgi:hypothetical protein